MSDTAVYKTEAGLIFRIVETDGHLTVEMLQDESWLSAPIGMTGLRVAPTTRRLTARQVLRLPV